MSVKQASPFASLSDRTPLRVSIVRHTRLELVALLDCSGREYDHVLVAPDSIGNRLADWGNTNHGTSGNRWH